MGRTKQRHSSSKIRSEEHLKDKNSFYLLHMQSSAIIKNFHKFNDKVHEIQEDTREI
ncbi:hypothetical protein KFK09_027569 [Dendrobium nobile]|uniref:Uncharacterized protein n=1 Tax=Dendrobium nobile TaxID=94219 RepID=A0A8T3AB40_DENNO|nr:hypothetical protein KFK09_027569 [Dendrobium nobile]